MKEDTYNCFEDLARENELEVHYRLETRAADPRVFVVAPHGGKIEPFTDTIARKLAGDNLSLHVFESLVARKKRNLHITSHRYNQPDAVRLAKKCQLGIGIHGRKDSSGIENDEVILLGGLNERARDSVAKALKGRQFQTKTEGHDFLAKKPTNICNLPFNNGLQLELTKKLRKKLIKDDDCWNEFYLAIREGLEL